MCKIKMWVGINKLRHSMILNICQSGVCERLAVRRRANRKHENAGKWSQGGVPLDVCRNSDRVEVLLMKNGISRLLRTRWIQLGMSA